MPELEQLHTGAEPWAGPRVQLYTGAVGMTPPAVMPETT
jgi:hypothetical protein